MAVDGAPPLEVRYDDLRLSAHLSASAHARSFVTVAETLIGAATALPRAIFTRPPPPKELHVLNGCSGVIRAGSTTLLLGCPGAGKSTFLKALTGRLPDPSALRGTVTYSGLDAKGLRAAGLELGQLVQLVSQLDEHFPFLTVRETLSFVAANIMPDGGDAKAVRARVDEVCTLLHLNACIDTIIGDELARGVSGGEKKRVTIGEGIITAARFLALDEISTGLDSSVTYDVVKSLRARSREHGISVVVALLQPTPETVALFDDIILLREGAVIFHGAREALPGYLSGLGFLVPTAGEEGGEDLADYLAELITFPKRRHEKDLARVGAAADAGATTEPSVGLPLSPSSGALDAAPSKAAPLTRAAQPPLTTEELVAAWQASPLRKVNLGEGAAPVAPPTLTTPAARAQYGQPYVHSGAVHALSLLQRQWRLLTANKLFMFMRVFSAFFMAILFGGLYFQGDVNDGLNKYGLFLNCVMQLLFANISEMSGAVEGKFIGYRQVANSVHPSWAFPLASILAHVPVAIVESLCFGGIAYFMCGMTYDAGRFFFFTLTIFLIDVYAATLFRLFAFSAPNLVSAQAGPMPIIALLIMFSGFMVARSKMGWLEFIFWLNPAGWAIQSLAQNEFYAPRYSFFPSFGTVTSTSTLGKSYLSLMDMQLDTSYQWYGILFIVAMTVVVASAQFAAFAFIRYDRNTGSARVSEDAPKDSVRVVLRADSSSNVLPQSASSGNIVVRDPSIGSIPSAATARSVLPFTPLALAWKDLSYTVKLSKQAGGGERTLLHGVTGYALPGRLIALMGASGAGKTTLLDVLSGRKNTGKQTGQIFLNGFLKDKRTFNRSASYCEQNDLHMPLTTVREAIAFSAELRLPSMVTAEQRAQFVLEILELLELTHCADAKVGNPGSSDGLSPGERKRLTIGVELAANSPIIFLDEPTSGLDARAAAVVVRVIRNIASTGRTIVCTVHQPSSEVFSMFDDLLLLQRGGWQTYFGPLGKRSASLLDYISALPGAPPCAPGFNASSYMLDVLAGTDSSGSSDTASTKNAALNGEVLQASYFASTAWTAKAAHVHDGLCKPAPGAAPVAFASSQARSFLQQVYVLTRRTWTMYQRNINMNVGRITAIIFLCTLFGTIYFNLANRAGDYQGMRTLVAAIFMTAAFSAMLNMDASLPTLISNRSSFYREQSALMYDSGAYVISNFLVELPWLAAIVLAGTSIGYFMIGLSASPSVFFTHYFATYILALVLVSFGNAVAATMPSFDTGQAVVGIFAPILFLFGGLFSKPSSMPPGSKWLNTIDPIGYAFRALIPLHFECAGGAAAGCPSISVLEVSVDRSDFVSSSYEVSYSQIWPSIGYMAIFIAVFQVLNVYSTYKVRHLSR